MSLLLVFWLAVTAAEMQADTAENVQKQAQLMAVIGQNQSAYKQAFGYQEWRAACEVQPSRSLLKKLAKAAR